eukprot:10249398-Karenia_brevis.AAC.1
MARVVDRSCSALRVRWQGHQEKDAEQRQKRSQKLLQGSRSLVSFNVDSCPPPGLLFPGIL